MRSLFARLTMMAFVGLPMTAAAQAPAGPIVIEGDLLLELVIRRAGSDRQSTVRIDFHVIIRDNRVEGSYSRTALNREGRPVFTEHNNISAVLGKAFEGKSDGGYGVAIMSGNKLTVLRTTKVGAVKITVTMGKGSSCGIQYQPLYEIGKGQAQRRGVDALDLEIISEKKVSSTCRLTRTS